MTHTRDILIIHMFAALHALTSLGCRAWGIGDDMLLTLLTMILITIICMRHQLNAIFMAIALVLANIIGFLVGNVGAHLLSLVLPNPLVYYPIATFLTTELLGWLVLGISRWSGTRFQSEKPNGQYWLMAAFALTIVVRFILTVPISDSEQRAEGISQILNYAFSCIAFVAVAEYGIRYRRLAKEEQTKANLAQYRYMILKHQVNPHFLFNSLNMLDCLIQEQPAEKASEYTHKLADVYRYLLKSEDETVVPLRDEMQFVRKYVDLLSIRFAEGLVVEIDVPEKVLSRSIAPCAIQLLVENATKHNAVSTSNPLIIRISADEESIKVENNLCPKRGRPSSTGLGQNYIRQQYKDLSDKSINVCKTETQYIVELPLL